MFSKMDYVIHFFKTEFLLSNIFSSQLVMTELFDGSNFKTTPYIIFKSSTKNMWETYISISGGEAQGSSFKVALEKGGEWGP